MLYAVCALSPTQLTILIVVIAVAVLILVGNIVLGYSRHKNTVRTLCTQQLQQKRNELLAHLEEVKYMGTASAADEEENEDYDPDDRDDDDGEGEENEISDLSALSENISACEILSVNDLTPELCEKFGFDSEKDREKRYYVRVRYGFDAQLCGAEQEIQRRYASFMREVEQYGGLKIKSGFSGQRICKGQKTVGLIFFKGKTLCAAFALDPANYAETKYRGIDKSGTKRFASTPMLLKLTSERKLEYAKYLFMQVADANTILLSESPAETEFDFTPKSNAELLAADMLRIQFVGEVPESAGKSGSEEKIPETV